MFYYCTVYGLMHVGIKKSERNKNWLPDKKFHICRTKKQMPALIDFYFQYIH